jgi:hypothetical protein
MSTPAWIRAFENALPAEVRAALALPPDNRQRSNSECLLELQRVAKAIGHTPSIGDFKKHALMSHGPVIRCFGTWNAGLQAAGLAIVHSVKLIPENDCSSELLRVSKLLGRTPTIAEFGKYASMSAATAYKRFGWNKLLKKAGLAINHREGISTAECLSELNQVTELLGRTPTQKDFIKHATIGTQPPYACVTVLCCELQHFGT